MNVMAVPSRTTWKGFLKLSLLSVSVKAFIDVDSGGVDSGGVGSGGVGSGRDAHLDLLQMDGSLRASVFKGLVAGGGS
ncbi:MAG: hypothetical protein ACI85K_001881 [Hyphomicrobiaceae bacterium]|jgi:hypothetical protein